MKKLAATILCISTVLSLAACSGGQPAQTTVTATSEETTTAPAAPSETTTAETAAAPKQLSDYVKDAVEKTTVTEPGEEPEEFIYHYPQILIKSSYADEVNKEMTSAVGKFKSEVAKEEVDEHFVSTSYIAYLTKEGILSLVFISESDYEYSKFKVYNIDTATGEKVDNARIAQTAGVSSIRKAAMDALQNWYNNFNTIKIEDYKVVVKKGKKISSTMKAVEKTFSEKYLNDNMQIGLTNDGKMFFSTTGEALNGDGAYECVFDINGTNLNDQDNPYWVGEKSPEDDEGGED